MAKRPRDPSDGAADAPKPKRGEAKSDVAASSSSIAEPISSPNDGPKATKPDRHPALTVVLEKACLEVGKVGKEHVLLNCDDHGNFLRKHKRDPAELRPTSCTSACSSSSTAAQQGGPAQALRAHREGRPDDVSPQIRIPRTFKRFCGLMAQPFASIRASNGPHKFLNVIKNP